MEVTTSTLFLLALGISSIVGVLTALFSLWKERKRREKAPTLEDRITSLTGNLKSSLSVISEIQTEIEKRGEIAQKLKTDVQQYEQLRELSQSQVEAIAQTIRNEIAGESRKSIWRNAIITFVIALAFFFLGWWIGNV